MTVKDVQEHLVRTYANQVFLQAISASDSKEGQAMRSKPAIIRQVDTSPKSVIA